MRLRRLFIIPWILIQLAACRYKTDPPLIPPNPVTFPTKTVPPTRTTIAPNPTSFEDTPTLLSTNLSATPASVINQKQSSINRHNVQKISLTNEYQFGTNHLVLDLVWLTQDSRLGIAVSDQVVLLDTTNMLEINRIDAGGWINDLDASPLGGQLVGARQDGSILIWDLESGLDPLTIKAHKKGANSVAFSPDGKVLGSGGNDGMARIWSSQDGKLEAEMIGGSYATPAVIFTHAGAGLAIANGNTIRVRDTITGRFIRTFRNRTGINSLAISPNGNLLAAGSVSGELSAWDLPSSELLWSLSIQEKNSNRAVLIWSINFNPDGTLIAAAGNDGSITVVTSDNGEVVLQLAVHSLPATSTAFSPDGVWLATGSLDGRITLWTVGR